MSDTYFETLRPGINSSIQDKGRNHLYHIGITISGAMDQRIFTLSNALVSNDLNEGVIEFAHQGPLLKLKNGSVNFAITGNVIFNILRKNLAIEEGKCFQNYLLEHEDQIDIITTKNSVFGYLAVEGGFQINKVWDSYSVNTKAKVGPNNGEKFSSGEKIYIKKSKVNNFINKKINYEKLTIIINDFLISNNLKIANIGKLYINKGPGSFAGIRNSLSVVKAFNVAKKIDYYCYSLDDFKGEKDLSYQNIPNLCDKFKIKKNLINPIYIS